MARAIALLLTLLPLVACAGGPQALGITGPQDSTLGATPPPAADPMENPNLMQSGVRYAPSAAPTTGSGRYWGSD